MLFCLTEEAPPSTTNADLILSSDMARFFANSKENNRTKLLENYKEVSYQRKDYSTGRNCIVTILIWSCPEN